jgi:hypothetical protein
VALVGACLTEWTQGADAAISMYSEPFYVLTAIDLLIATWQTSVSYVSGGADETERQKSGIWFESPDMNMLVTFMTYMGVQMVYFAKVLFIRQCQAPAAQCDFVASHPDYSTCLSNLFMNTAFFNNFAVFEATLVKYKLITSFQASAIYLPLTAGVLVVILRSFFLADGGQAMPDLLHYVAHQL